MSAVFSIGIFLSLFLAVLLFAKQSRSVADSLLGIWMVVIALHLTSNFLHHLGYWDSHLHLVGLTHPFPLLYGPLLYLYISTSLRRSHHLSRQDLLHFLPFVIVYLMTLPFILGHTAEEKRLMNSEGYHSDYQWFFQLSLILFVASILYYSIRSYRLLKIYEEYIQEHYAYQEKISLRWLQYLLVGTGVIFLVAIAVALITELGGVALSFNADLIGFSLLVLFVALLGYYGIRYQGIFAEERNVTTPKEPSDEVAEEEEKPAPYQHSTLTKEQGQQLYQELLALMESEAPYLEPKLSLSALADRLQISANTLSQVINQYSGKNFFDFINAYRVEEFIERATKSENSHLSLLAIALDSGFNSKSSFYQVFKKHTGTSPSAYLSEVAQ